MSGIDEANPMTAHSLIRSKVFTHDAAKAHATSFRLPGLVRRTLD